MLYFAQLHTYRNLYVHIRIHGEKNNGLTTLKNNLEKEKKDIHISQCLTENQTRSLLLYMHG